MKTRNVKILCIISTENREKPYCFMECFKDTDLIKKIWVLHQCSTSIYYRSFDYKNLCKLTIINNCIIRLFNLKNQLINMHSLNRILTISNSNAKETCKRLQCKSFFGNKTRTQPTETIGALYVLSVAISPPGMSDVLSNSKIKSSFPWH